MGFYINPGNENFRVIRNDEYIDKSGLITVVNHTIGKKAMLSCVSRPRRFGKSYAANMLEGWVSEGDYDAVFKKVKLYRFYWPGMLYYTHKDRR